MFYLLMGGPHVSWSMHIIQRTSFQESILSFHSRFKGQTQAYRFPKPVYLPTELLLQM